MTADTLLRLAERCETEEPGRALDIAIGCAALGLEFYADGLYAPIGGTGWSVRTGDLKLYTTSLDAAVTLVPPNATWEVSKWGDAEVTVLTGRFLISDDIERHGRAAEKPALALCAAALRARAALLTLPTSI